MSTQEMVAPDYEFTFHAPTNARYAWELYDADDLMVASGDHPSLASACREAGHYYNQYAQDGPHRYIVEQRTIVLEVNPISES